MAEAKSNRFTTYFPLLLDALRSADPNPMRPAEAMAWIRSRAEVPADDLTRFVQNGTQSIFENDVHWARFYLVKAGLLGNARRGLVIAHPTPARAFPDCLADSTNRTVSRIEAPFALAVLTTERKAA